MAVVSVFPLASCQDMLSPGSDTVEFVEDNQLNTVHDTLYTVLGIVSEMQKIADRTVILGEVRGDLVANTDKASTSIKELASFDVKDGNLYNNIADFYAVINNCNYFLANANMNLHKLGEQTFEKEYAVVKAYRAWTYLQLAKIYGEVPLVLEPVTTISQAELAEQQDYKNIKEICNFFIEDLKPYVNTIMPNYAVTSNGTQLLGTSRKFFIPVRVLLGELCLWAERYNESAQFFHDYLTFNNHAVTTGTSKTQWGSNIKEAMQQGSQSPWSGGFISDITDPESDEIISYIPMELSQFNGTISSLEDVYQSTLNNKYYAQVVPSASVKQLSRSQKYCQVNDITAVLKDTVILEESDYKNLKTDLLYGDLRLNASYTYAYIGQDITSHYSADRNTIMKFSRTCIPTYRVQQVYLMFAEALNLAGFPETAFAILKYGICQYNMEKMHYISEKEQARAARFLGFKENTVYANNFDQYNTQGIHSRGSGDAYANKDFYKIDMPKQASYEDSIPVMMPLVEEKILEEMALEEAFEGTRYYNLMRMALRKNNPAILAEAVAKRNGTKDEALFTRLMDKKNWYLPIKK